MIKRLLACCEVILFSMAIPLKRHRAILKRGSSAGRFLGLVPKKKRTTLKGLTSSSYRTRIR